MSYLTLRCWFGFCALAVAARLAGGAEMAFEPSTDRTWKTVVDWVPSSFAVDRLSPLGSEYLGARLTWGDDVRWAQPEWDDQAWLHVGFSELPVRSGIGWLRFRMRLPYDPQPQATRLVLTFLAAYDVYWDGERIGNSGLPGDRFSTETPGPRVIFFSVPVEKIGAGDHVVALRFSNHHLHFSTTRNGLRASLVPPAEHDALRARIMAPLLMALGQMSFLAVVSGLIWLLAAPRRDLLLLSGMFFCVALHQGCAAAETFFNIPYHWTWFLTNSAMGFCATADLLSVGFLVNHFKVPKGRWLLIALAAGFAVALVVYQPRLAALPAVYTISTYSVALGCSLWALRERKRWAWVALIGTAVTFLWAAVVDVDSPRVFLKTQPAFFAFIALVVLDVRAERRKARDTQLAAARLEIELLKKNLQPHFLFNTLTVLSEMVEQDSALAVRLIDDLAQEFRSLVRVAGEKQIPLHDELELCRTHLRIMNVRTGLDWKLDTEKVDDRLAVPPALFLTLIENGFTHQQPTDGETTFVLQQTIRPHGAHYFFFSPGKVEARSMTKDAGTGLRYVKARLEESSPDGWKFTQQEVPGGWNTFIEIRERPVGNNAS